MKRQTAYLSAAAAVALSVALSWNLAPLQRYGAPLGREGDQWQVPRLAKPPDPAVADALARSGLWGKLPDAAPAASLNAPSWRFLGIVRQGEDRFVLIKVDGQPEARLSLTDKLPGGSEIIEIGDDSLCILINGQRRRLAIYKLGSQVL